MATDDEHDGLNCPECKAMADAAQVIGNMGQALQNMLDNGTIERIGYEVALEYERRMLEALLR